MVKSKFLNTSNDRHAAVTDGVFAIAMTILVLEIAVPTITDISSGVALNEYFLRYLAPSILIYFISFYIVSVCMIPFATGFLFNFYNYTNANIFFSLLILIISLLYILMFMLLIKNNFKEYFDNKDELKTAMHNSYDDGFELPNLRLYLRGVTLTLFYLLLAPVITSLLSLLLAFISPKASILSFLLTLVLVFLIRTRRFASDNLVGLDLTDEEKEFLGNLRNSIYGE